MTDTAEQREERSPENTELFLIATHNNLFRLALNHEERSGRVQLISRGARFYGTAATGEDIWVVKNTRNHEDIAQIVNLRDDSELDFETPLKDVHQISRSVDGRGLFICNTYYNSVVYKDLASGAEHSYTIGGAFEHDYAHPNSLWIDPPYVYVLLHNKRFRCSELCRLKHSRRSGFEVGYRCELRYKLPHAASHNIRFDGPILTYLASESGGAVQVNHLTGEMLRSFPSEAGYLKGMATFGDGKLLVGANPHLPAAQRYDAPASVAVVDTFDAGFEYRLPIEMPDGEPPGNINEIRRLS